MGWQNYHCYEFIIDGISYGEPDDELGFEMKEARKFKLNQIVKSEKQKFIYNYDFGDDWNHEIVVEKILKPKLNAQYPVCLAGELACPPEDCGGVSGYEELFEIIKEPEHEEYEDTIEWIGKDFDPEAFNLKSINRELTYHKQKGSNLPSYLGVYPQIQPKMYPTINRGVAIIKPKSPLLNWLKGLPAWDLNMTLEDLRDDCTAILIPELEKEEAIGYIEDIYEAIFEMELESWERDKRRWPKKRNLEIFREWFEIEIHLMVMDAVEEEIIRE